MDSRIKRTAIAMAVATALALPSVALAQATDKEKALEARVAELEKLVQEMMADKKAAPAPAPAAAPAPAPAPAPTVATGNKGSLTVKGFVVASLYAEDANFAFGSGQNAEFVSSEYSTDKYRIGADVRNTRLTLDWQGPNIDDLKFAGLVELDLFGGFGTPVGAFVDEQPVPRLRLAYADITRGNTTYRIGQGWSPLFGNVPVSPAHVAFPLGYGAAGTVGWRYPGLFVYHNLSKTTKLTLAVLRGSWSDAGESFGLGAGESGFPQIEARLDFAAGPWNMYLVGHYDEKDCNYANDAAPNFNECGAGYSSKSLDGSAVEFGAKAAFGAFSVQGNVYQGTAIGQQFGQITQFGDISGWGGWIQGSYKFNPTWSGNLFFGMEDPDDADVFDSGNSRLKSEQIAASVIYSKGPYMFGVEWLNNNLTTGSRNSETGAVTENDLEGNQLSFSAWYKF